jgi:pyruvate, water dikinase
VGARSSFADVGEIRWLGERGADDRATVGRKVAELSRLSARFPVPPGFCVRLVGEPGDLSAAGEAYRALGERCGEPEPAVAVRSSAVAEDAARTSFAGQHDTYLHVRGEEAVLEAIVRCASSARTPRALAYRERLALGSPPPWVPVLVQALVAADVGVVAFSADPVTGDRGRIAINASWGLGASIVDGTVTPDTYVVHRAGLRIAERTIAAKRRMTVAVVGGSREVAVPAVLHRVPALDDDRVLQTARLVLAVEAEVGYPVDLEAAWAGGRLHLLQCRPITALPEPAIEARRP